MKKTTFFKTIAAALLAVVGTGAFAQYVGPTAGTYTTVQVTDYVTIGSRMPYYVTPDATISAMVTATTMNPSVFRWQFTTDGTTPIAPALTPLTYAGAAATAAPVTANFITQNEISVVWTGAGVTTGSSYVVSATERSFPLSGEGDGCTGDKEDRDVIVLPRPTIDFPAASSGACGITPGPAATYYVPIDVTGLGVWDITYNVTYNGAAYLSGQSATGLGTATVTSDATVVADAAATTSLAGTPTAATAGIPIILNGATAAGGFGYYDVTVTNITDRISRKSLTPALIAAQASDLPAAAYRIYVNPTPNTTPVQHLNNN